MPGALLAALIVVVAALVVAGISLQRWSTRRQAIATEHADPATPTLAYRVPAGQDPAAVLTALAQEGFAASTEPGDSHLVRVHTPAGLDRDRAHVRAVIASVHTSAIDAGVPFEPGDVRFVDEDGRA